MNIKIGITPEMKLRVAAIAERTGLSESQVAADRGAFASEADIERVRGERRSA